MDLVGLYGYHGSGKTTTAEYLQANYPNWFVVAHLADLLKTECAAFYNLPLDTFYSTSKKDKKLSLPVISTDNITGAIQEAIGANRYYTPRDLMIAYGAFRRFYNENYWIEALLNKYKDESKIILIPDVRYMNEVIEIKTNGGKLVKIVREGWGRKRDDDSEKQQDSFKPDLILDVKDGLENLYNTVEDKLVEIIRF